MGPGHQGCRYCPAIAQKCVEGPHCSGFEQYCMPAVPLMPNLSDRTGTAINLIASLAFHNRSFRE